MGDVDSESRGLAEMSNAVTSVDINVLANAVIGAAIEFIACLASASWNRSMRKPFAMI